MPLFGSVRVTLAQLVEAQGQLLDYRIVDENGHFIGECLLTLAPLLVTVEVSEVPAIISEERNTSAFFADSSSLKASIIAPPVKYYKFQKSAHHRVRLKICTGCDALVHPRKGQPQNVSSASMQVIMPSDNITPKLGLFLVEEDSKMTYLDQTELQHIQSNPIFRKSFVLDTFLDQQLVIDYVYKTTNKIVFN